MAPIATRTAARPLPVAQPIAPVRRTSRRKAQAARRRPWPVLVVAILNFLAAALCLYLIADLSLLYKDARDLGMHESFLGQVRQILITYSGVAVVHLALGVFLLRGSSIARAIQVTLSFLAGIYVAYSLMSEGATLENGIGLIVHAASIGLLCLPSSLAFYAKPPRRRVVYRSLPASLAQRSA